MSNSQTTRRSFLSSLAILTTGAAFASAADLLSPIKSKNDLMEQWSSFYEANGGERFYGMIEQDMGITPCKGHSYKTGKAVYFPHENILAQPTWVYWGNENDSPADVIITFFKDERNSQQFYRINRFELQALCALSAEIDGVTLMPIWNAAMQNRGSLKKQNNVFLVKTMFRQGKQTQIFAALSGDGFSIEKKLIYNS